MPVFLCTVLKLVCLITQPASSSLYLIVLGLLMCAQAVNSSGMDYEYVMSSDGSLCVHLSLSHALLEQ